MGGFLVVLIKMKTAIFIGTLGGSTLGAMVPMLWGDSNLISFTSLTLSFIGSVLGFLAGVKIGGMLEL